MQRDPLGSWAAGGRLGGVPLRPLVVGTRLVSALGIGGALLLPVTTVASVGLITVHSAVVTVTAVATTLLLTRETPAGRATTMTLNASANSLGVALGGGLGGLLLAVADYPAIGLAAMLLGGLAAALVWWSRPAAAGGDSPAGAPDGGPEPR